MDLIEKSKPRIFVVAVDGSDNSELGFTVNINKIIS